MVLVGSQRSKMNRLRERENAGPGCLWVSKKKKRFLRVEWITSTEWLLVWWWWWVWLPQKWKLMPIKVGPSTSYLNIMDSLCKSFLLISIITEWCWKLDLLQLQCTLCHASRALQYVLLKRISFLTKKKKARWDFFFLFFLFFVYKKRGEGPFFRPWCKVKTLLRGCLTTCEFRKSKLNKFWMKARS